MSRSSKMKYTENGSMALNNMEHWGIALSNAENGSMVLNNSKNGTITQSNAENWTTALKDTERSVTITTVFIICNCILLLVLCTTILVLFRLRILNRCGNKQQYSYVSSVVNKRDSIFQSSNIYAQPEEDDLYITPICTTRGSVFKSKYLLADPMGSSYETSLDIPPSDYQSYTCSDTETPNETSLCITPFDCADSGDKKIPVCFLGSDAQESLCKYPKEESKNDLISDCNITGESDVREESKKVNMASPELDCNSYEYTVYPRLIIHELTRKKCQVSTNEKQKESVNVVAMSIAPPELPEKHFTKEPLPEEHHLHEYSPLDNGQHERLPEKHGPCCDPIKISLNVPVNNKEQKKSKGKAEHGKSKSELTIEFVEQCFSYKPESIVAVKPLKAADDASKGTEQSTEIVKKMDFDEQQGSKENNKIDNEHTHKYLDWDKIIRYLAQRIPPREWKLFFNCLFDYGRHMIPSGMSIEHKISQIESDVLGKWGSLSNLMFELFNLWKEIMGTEANTEHIDRALSEMGYNLIASEFRQFLRGLPLQSRYTDKDLRMATTHPMHISFVGKGQPYMDIFALHNTTETVNISESNRLQVSRRESDEVSLHIATNNAPYYVKKFPSLPGTSGCNNFRAQTVPGRKRYSFKADETSSDSDSESIPFKKQRLSNARLGRQKKVLQAKRKTSSSCVRGDLVRMSEADKDSVIIDLIKRLLVIDQDLDSLQYNLFVTHVLTEIKEKANISEFVLYSIKLSDFENVQQIKGRHSHVTYLLDTEETMLHFNSNEWELLKLYGEKARGYIEQRLKIQNGENFVLSKYLFIKYSGQAFIEEQEDSTPESGTGSSLSSLKSTSNQTGIENAESGEDKTLLRETHFRRTVKVASSNTNEENCVETNENEKCLSKNANGNSENRNTTRELDEYIKVTMNTHNTNITTRRKSI